MRLASSLSNRIFLACTLLAALSLGFAFSFVNARASAEAEVELRRGLTDSAALVETQRQALTDTFTRMARLEADHPKPSALARQIPRVPAAKTVCGACDETASVLTQS